MKTATQQTEQLKDGVKIAEEVPYAVWKQRDGAPIEVRAMDDKHLFNTIRMLERVAERRMRSAESAENSVSTMQDGDAFFDYDAETFLPPIHALMVAVAAARGILL